MQDEETLPPFIRQLLAQGVSMPAPETVYVGPEVQPERIAPGVVLHPGCRVRGATTAIGPCSELGREQPVTVEDCQLAGGVRLAGGYFHGSVFLDQVVYGSAGHVRPGCLLEEGAGAGHAVGLKQTILMPWVTLGSLINLCDCLIAGGTGRHDHGEVGSSYVHFNFSTHGDKATPSIAGDVPRGVMLDQPPVFLGGQGGMVGPVRVAFGSTVAAGSILRHDVLEPGRLVREPGWPSQQEAHGHGQEQYDRCRYRDPMRIVFNNLFYIGNLRALMSWYREARRLRVAGRWAQACHEGALAVLVAAVEERRRRLAELFAHLPDSLAAWRARASPQAARAVAEHETLIAAWPELQDRLAEEPVAQTEDRSRDALLAALSQVPPGLSWTQAIQSLAPDVRLAGSRWLESIVASTTRLLPSLSGGETGAG